MAESKKFADYKAEGHLWITLSTGEYYPVHGEFVNPREMPTQVSIAPIAPVVANPRT